MQIEKLKELVTAQKVEWSWHCQERMKERGIEERDVLNCISNGEIIEDYPEDYPFPSCLICGKNMRKQFLHTVVGCDGECICIITAYYPEIMKFNADMKTRREN